MRKSKPLDASESNKSSFDPWLLQALRLARQAASIDEVPVGAIVIHDNQIIGEGYNLREKHQDPTAHAEMTALVQASKKLGSWRLVGCTLVVTLEPCPMCLAASQLARVDQIIYGATDPKGGALSLGYKLHEDPRTNHRFPVELYENEACAQILKDFFKAKRKNRE